MSNLSRTSKDNSCIWSFEERVAWMPPEEMANYTFLRVLEIERHMQRLKFLEGRVDILLRHLGIKDDGLR